MRVILLFRFFPERSSCFGFPETRSCFVFGFPETTSCCFSGYPDIEYGESAYCTFARSKQ